MDNNVQALIEELKELDNELVEIDGNHLKPSQCFHFEANPVHLLFNTNCPDQLKERVEAIMSKHLSSDESSTSQ